MDLSSFTTDDLLAALPPDNEDDRWELKSACYLAPQKRGELKKELGKQVSAFANSGGGFLVFGLSNDRQLEPCDNSLGRQPMKDFLATMVEQSVEYPIRHFRVHRIPFKIDAAQAVFVIAIEDSPAAPHQAKDERIYYYRIDGHSKPAPHFHIELLRNRLTKAVLQIEEATYSITFPNSLGDLKAGEVVLKVTATISVNNVSSQIADPCALRVFSGDPASTWFVGKDRRSLQQGILLRDSPAVLFPLCKDQFVFELATFVSEKDEEQFDQLFSRWIELELLIQPLSQNCAGEIVRLRPAATYEDNCKVEMQQTWGERTNWNEAIPNALDKARSRFSPPLQ